MRSLAFLGILGSAIFAAPLADAATISGKVTGPDGAPFRGAFVQARHAGLKMTVSVMSDGQGRYFAENLPAGEYRVQVRAIGFKTDPKTGMKLTADQDASADFALSLTPVRWTEISQLQGYQLLPNLKGKETLFQNCMGCHGFQSRMAAVVRDEDGWRDRVNFMREAMRSSLADRNGFNDQQADEVVSYLSHVFSETSDLAKSPADLPTYKDTLFQPSDEALKIVYVDYEMPGPNRFPWTSNGDKDGFRWTPEYGQANKVMRFNPKTAEMKEFQVPNLGPALIHSAVPAADGSVWMTEAGAKKLGALGSQDREDNRVPGRLAQAHHPHHPGRTHLVDRRDVGIRSQIREVHQDPGDPDRLRHRARSAEQRLGHRDDQDRSPRQDRSRHLEGDQIHTADPRSGRAASRSTPTASCGSASTSDGKIGRFDPETETFKEFPLPHAKSAPYALGIAPDHTLWYSSDPAT